jgi:hypothetical protein
VSGGRRAARGWWAGFIACAGAGTALAVAQSYGHPILAARWRLLWLLAAWSVVWGLGAWCALHLPGRRRLAVGAVLAAGIAMRVGSLAGAPTLSNDLYRYSWDARVQLSGTDPYRYPPDSARVAGLREPWLWPDHAVCAHLRQADGCTRINRPDVRTIYPPVAEAWFTTAYQLGGGIAARYKVWQVAGLLVEVGTMALLARALAQRRRDPRWVALYALCPFPAVEFVDNGHVDGLGILALVAAFVVLGTRDTAGGLTARRAAAVGALIGVAALVKLYPAFALLPLWLAPAVRWRHRLASLAGLVGVVVAGYAPHVAAVGVKVLGYLPGYLKEEHYTGTSSRFLLVDLLHLHATHANDVVVAVAIAATVVLLARARPPALGAAVTLLGVCILCATPVQPWYAVTLLALATVAGRPRWALVVLAGYPYFFAVILASPHQEAIGQWCFGAAALGVVALWARARRRDAQLSRRRAGPGTRPWRGAPTVAARGG